MVLVQLRLPPLLPDAVLSWVVVIVLVVVLLWLKSDQGQEREGVAGVTTGPEYGGGGSFLVIIWEDVSVLGGDFSESRK